MSLQMTTIGKVISPFGIKGEVKVYPYSDFLDRCYLLKKVKLEGESYCGFKDVIKAYIHQKLWVFHFEGCSSRDDARELYGLLVKIFSSERVPLPSGEYYLDQLIGLQAFTVEGRKLGYVKDIIRSSNDVYVISNQEAGEEAGKRKDILIPALKTVVKEINLEKGIILIDPLPGLFD
jgi:16S rRNA processing protein RimM